MSVIDIWVLPIITILIYNKRFFKNASIFVRYWKCNTLKSTCKVYYRAVRWNHVELQPFCTFDLPNKLFILSENIDLRLSFSICFNRRLINVLTKKNFDNSSSIPDQGDCTPLEISTLLILYHILAYIILIMCESKKGLRK